MRIALLAAGAAAAFLSGCGGPKTSQNHAQAGAGTTASNGMVMLAAAPNKEQALQIMKVRHDGMEGLGKAMKELHRQLESSSPDINVIRAQTGTMSATAAKIPSLFPAGTGPDVGKTRAKPEIWTQQKLFQQRAKEYLAAAQAIDAAAKAGDVKKVMALHDDVDKACDACHKPFRAPEH